MLFKQSILISKIRNNFSLSFSYPFSCIMTN